MPTVSEPKSWREIAAQELELPAVAERPAVAFDAEAYVRARCRERIAERFRELCPARMQTAATCWDDPVAVANAAEIARVRGWAGGPKGLLLTGPTGRMKTRSMWALIERLTCGDGREVDCYKAADWFSRLQGEVNYGRDEAAGWVRAVAKRPLVWIDDFGQESLMASRQAWAHGWFFDFCDRRVELGLPLFLTTNLSAKDMAGSYGDLRGDPLLRRLLALCEPVKFK